MTYRKRWGHHAEAIAALELQRQVAHHRLLFSRRHHVRVLDDEALVRRLQRHRLGFRRDRRQQPPQPIPTLSRRHPASSMGDGNVDRRESPGTEDRAGDDDSTRGFLMDDEVGANSEHG
jgi:hypothetical protein